MTFEDGFSDSTLRITITERERPNIELLHAFELHLEIAGHLALRWV